jgi:hypothetical protein
MSDHFDPYHKWLAIPPEEQPANHYRLLGLRLFEDDPDVIETSADRQMGHVRRFATGQRGELSQKLLNEISAAKVCLLTPAKRAAYDATIKAQQQAKAVPKAQALPTAQVLPQAQALPQSGYAAQPQLRTRDEHTASAGFDAPIVSGSRSGRSTLARRKKKSSPTVAIVLLVATAAVVIGIANVVLKKPEDVAVAPQVKPKPSQPIPVSPPKPVTKIIPAKIPNRTELNADGEPAASGLANGKVAPTTRVSSDTASTKSPSRKPVNLLASLNLKEQIVAGEGWQLENKALTIPADDKAHIQSAVSLPENYLLALQVERLSGEGTFHLGLPLAEGEITCEVDRIQPMRSDYASGFFDAAGQDLSVDRTSQLLPVNKKVQLICAVRGGNVQLNLGGKSIASWKLDGR